MNTIWSVMLNKSEHNSIYIEVKNREQSETVQTVQTDPERTLWTLRCTMATNCPMQ